MHIPPFIPRWADFRAGYKTIPFSVVGILPCISAMLCAVMVFFFLFFPGIYYADLDPFVEPISFFSSLLLFSPFMSATVVIIIFANLFWGWSVFAYSRTGPCQGG